MHESVELIKSECILVLLLAIIIFTRTAHFETETKELNERTIKKNP